MRDPNMSDDIIPMPWKVVCGIACTAMIKRLTFDQVLNIAIREQIVREQQQPKKRRK